MEIRDDEGELSETEQEWKRLYNEYLITIKTTHGCGSRGDYYIEAAYQKLVLFVKEHPNPEFKLPNRYKCFDDGLEGAFSGVASISTNRDECSIQ